jgi:putative hydrolase of the HAD superfamily
MSDITTLFWDIGGVVLTNGWEHAGRRTVAERFGLDPEELEQRHAPLLEDFECGRVPLEEYLKQTVFYTPRPFTLEEFRSAMTQLSAPLDDRLQILRAISDGGQHQMGMLNNESLELNLYRIRKFELRSYFDVFCSSCFLGVRKPNEEIYRRALQIVQRDPGQCIFIDDRPENLEAPRRLGMYVIHCRETEQLRQELEFLGVATEEFLEPEDEQFPF